MPNPTLSARDRQILELICRGFGNDAIALELGISVNTVKKERSHLYEKINAHDTAGAISWAYKTGFIESKTDWKH